MECFSGLKRASFHNSGEGEAIGFNAIGEHLGEVHEGKVLKTQLGMAVDNGGPEVDSGVVGAVEKGDGVVEAAERGVRALELEVQDWVVVETVTEEKGVNLEKVVDGF